MYRKISQSIAAAALAACCAIAASPAQAVVAGNDDVSTASPYNDTTVTWSTPSSELADTQIRARALNTPDSVGPESYSFESKELDDGAQTLIHINNENAPRQYAFPVELGPDDRLELMEDGTVSLNSDRFPSGSIRETMG